MENNDKRNKAVAKSKTLDNPLTILMLQYKADMDELRSIDTVNPATHEINTLKVIAYKYDRIEIIDVSRLNQAIGTVMGAIREKMEALATASIKLKNLNQ